ncbi:hypothetical protein FBQ85_23965 [Cytophagia bacterium CHB2]|nr:hypothetical protein [Cytophagia bacterium CHB2]
MNDKLQHLIFHEVDRQRLNAFVTLFESRGGPKYCWCMAWRASRSKAARRGQPFMGFVSAFKRAGFVEVGRTGTRRHVMRLNLKKFKGRS